MKSRIFGYGLVAVAACSWGTWPLILRHAESIGHMEPALEAVIMMTVLTLVSAPFSAVDRVRVRADARAWRMLVWLGVGDAMNVILFFAAYQKTSVAVAVLTHYLTPIFVAVAAPFVLKETTGARTWGAAFVSFTGLVLLLAPWSAAPGAVAVIALGSVGPGALAGLLFTWGLRRVPASHASTLTLLEPLVAMMIAAFVYGEHMGAGGVVGAAFILAGAAVVVSGRPAVTKG